MPRNKNVFAVLFFLPLFFLSCNNSKSQTYKSPPGYDINKPEKFGVNASLNEISGIAFLNGNAESALAIEDEKGKLYQFSTGKENTVISKFAKKGDYEDVTILNNNTVVVLRSEGSLLEFPVSAIGKETIDSVKVHDSILPPGEYEGLFAADGKLFALCKNCPGDKEKIEVSVFTLEQANGAPLRVTNTFKINISMVQPAGEAKTKFHPSAIAKHPLTHEWFIVSSVNKLLLVLDEQWKVKDYFPLDPSLFKQPEGMAFSSNGDLYISNEGAGGSGNILLFRYKAQ